MLKILLLLLLSTACQDAPTPPTAADPADLIDHTAFADFGLEKAVRAVLAKPRGELLAEELEALETLDAVQLNIQSLEGIERLSGLRRLTLGANRLATSAEASLETLTPLSSLTALQFLDLSDNQISRLDDLDPLTRLTALDLSGNAITNVQPLRKLDQLTHLDLKNNAIIDIEPLADLRRLRLLNLDNNEVRDITPLMGLRLLGSLELSGNPLTDLDALKTFERRGVQVNYFVPFVSPFDAAIEEDIRGHLDNLKGPISDDALKSLTFLNTAGPIQSLNGLDRLSNVETLFIRFNASTNTQPFNDLTPLAALFNLKTLTVRDASIRDILPIGALIQLEDLSLPNNDISSVEDLANLTRLTFLNLAQNQIVDLKPLRKLNRLATLNLTDNDVSDLTPLLEMNGLKNIWVRGNHLSTFSRNTVIPALRARGAFVIGL